MDHRRLVHDGTVPGSRTSPPSAGSRWDVGSALHPTGVVVFATLQGSGPSPFPVGSLGASGMLSTPEPAVPPLRHPLQALRGTLDWLLGR